ncbi:biotin/lipoate--protein ligase family protein [Roseomonas marmotae]|uniref:BPL/LPL catalytic domain-containing protein n=1 Tax=Roseomonas marmotae TaxID=2768161 RepID=A0ABS3KEL7_9PROT|nr:biotin/lipoate--protein ligase family protein [Roseomonas marmotae]MBO1075108.1 hypothetical protein [Roseomonas marmotae]QTI79777.1 hypothetical protein IAI58_02950 [Roseomonas marmotae]
MQHLLPPLPSVFSPVLLPAGADALAHAAAIAGSHGAGTLVWGEDGRVLQLAVVLEPETTLAAARPALLVALNAMADALGVLGPPEIPVTLRWPAGLLVNGGLAGHACLATLPGAAEDAVPDWIVAGIRLDLRDDSPEPGLHPDRTTLAEEGFGGIDIPELVAAWARHLMAGLAEWQAEGFRRLADRSLSRLETEAWMVGARRGLDPGSGALVLERDGDRSLYPLEPPP